MKRGWTRQSSVETDEYHAINLPKSTETADLLRGKAPFFAQPNGLGAAITTETQGLMTFAAGQLMPEPPPTNRVSGN